MKPFRERNPVPIGVGGIAVLGLLMYVAFHAQDLTVFGGGGDKYSAAFTDSGDIAKADEVRIAGVKVGTVTGVELEGDHVGVKFRLEPGQHIGNATRAQVKIKTVVGTRYLELDPAGPANQRPSDEIPASRTESNFTTQNAFDGLTGRVDQINTDQLAQSFNVLSDDFANTPAVNKQALVGLSRLSKTVTSRDTALSSLLTNAQAVTTTLNSRDTQLTKLIGDSDLVLQELQARRQVISDLLTHTSDLAKQITGLARDNEVQLAPTLSHLNGVLQVLEKNRDNIDRSIQELAPYSRLFTNTLGNGRWFDTYVANLPPSVSLNGLLGALTGVGVTPGPGTGTTPTGSSK